MSTSAAARLEPVAIAQHRIELAVANFDRRHTVDVAARVVDRWREAIAHAQTQLVSRRQLPDQRRGQVVAGGGRKRGTQCAAVLKLLEGVGASGPQGPGGQELPFGAQRQGGDVAEAGRQRHTQIAAIIGAETDHSVAKGLGPEHVAEIGDHREMGRQPLRDADQPGVRELQARQLAGAGQDDLVAVGVDRGERAPPRIVGERRLEFVAEGKRR